MYVHTYKIVYIDHLYTCVLENGLLNLAEQIYKNHDEQITQPSHTIFF